MVSAAWLHLRPRTDYQMIESLFEAALLKQLIQVELVSQFQSSDGSRGFKTCLEREGVECWHLVMLGTKNSL